MTLIVGAAAGFLAVRFMGLQTSALVAIGIGVLGAMALIWVYRRFFGG